MKERRRWSGQLRSDWKAGWVSVDGGDTVRVSLPAGQGFYRHHDLARKDARMLAKRLNQCLDETKK